MENISMDLFPADKVRLDCENLAQYMKEIMIALLICHGCSIPVLLFREIKETTLGAFGQIMRFFEVLGIGYYVMNIIKCCQI
jgi:hypothetical protein